MGLLSVILVFVGIICGAFAVILILLAMKKHNKNKKDNKSLRFYNGNCLRKSKENKKVSENQWFNKCFKNLYILFNILFLHK